MTMREILFRGKHVLDGRWIEGFYNGVRPDLATMQTKECHRLFSLKSLAYDVVPDTIGQFTGLTDKNGKKIFEGDICRNTKTNEIVSVKWHGTMAGYVWSKRKADNRNLYVFGELFRAFDKYEVIGNIHDNPELMEDK